MKFKRRIGDHDVVADADEDFAARAESLLATLADLHAAGPPLHEGSTVQFGWSMLTLRTIGDELVVHEPGFRSEDPDHNLEPTVDDTLKILGLQIGLLDRLRVAPMEVDYREKVVAAKGALAATHVFMLRQAPTSPDDSGWYIGDAEDADRRKERHELESIRVHRLIRKPSLMSALTLPTGYLATFMGTVLVSVSDAERKRIYSV